jgi:hypothetical protein
LRCMPIAAKPIANKRPRKIKPAPVFDDSGELFAPPRLPHQARFLC